MRLLFVFCICLLFACSTTKTPEELTTNDIRLSLKKEGCFGSCPVYTLNVYDGGYCEFIGLENCYKIGKHSLQLTKEKYKSLYAEFKSADLFQFQDYYESNIPDLPSITISYFEKDTSKTIVGKRERPEIIHKLQFLLEEIAESKTGWTVIDGSIEEKKEVIDKSKIVIELKNGAQLSRWFNDYRQSHGIRIIKQLDNDYDKWLVSYNTNDYAPTEILEILKKDENVSSAEFLKVDP